MDFETNAVGTFNILEAVRNSNQNPTVINISSNKIYGAPRVELLELENRYDFKDLAGGVDEETSISALEPYGISKAIGDLYTRTYQMRYGLRAASLRFSLIYGPRQWGSEEQGFVAWFCVACILGQPVRIFGNGKQVRDLLFVTDAISAVDLAVSRMNEISGSSLNIGGGKENSVSLLELLAYITEMVAKKKIELIFTDWREHDVKCFYTRYQKANQILGWKPKVSWKKGVLNLYQWLLANIENVKDLYSH
jgi:CDP-paratose 2-epimerase